MRPDLWNTTPQDPTATTSYGGKREDDVPLVGGGAAGLSAGLVLLRARSTVAPVDAVCADVSGLPPVEIGWQSSLGSGR